MNVRLNVCGRLLLGLLTIVLAGASAVGGAEAGVESGVLMHDAPSGNYRNAKEASYAPARVLGSEIPRDHVLSIAFVDSLADAPADAWDVSDAGDGSVLAWVDPAEAPGEAWGYAYSQAQMEYVPQVVATEGDYFELTIGAEGGVTVNADGAQLFAAYLNLRSIRTNGCLDTSRVTDMSGMFRDDASLAALDLSGFDTSNVTDFSEMFDRCGRLAALDVSGFNTAKGRNMELMFAGCAALEALDLRGFDTSEVTNMSHMFWNCASLRALDLTGFDTAKAQKMQRMFTMAESLEAVLVSGKFVLPEDTDMQAMFYGCIADGFTMS